MGPKIWGLNNSDQQINKLDQPRVGNLQHQTTSHAVQKKLPVWFLATPSLVKWALHSTVQSGSMLFTSVSEYNVG